VSGRLFAEPGQRRPRNVYDTVKVRLDLGAEIFISDVFDRSKIAVTGIIYQDIQTAKSFNRLLNCATRCCCVSHIKCKREHLLAILCFKVGQLLWPARSGDEPVSRCKNCFSKLAAEAARTTGNEPNFRHDILPFEQLNCVCFKFGGRARRERPRFPKFVSQHHV